MNTTQGGAGWRETAGQGAPGLPTLNPQPPNNFRVYRSHRPPAPAPAPARSVFLEQRAHSLGGCQGSKKDPALRVLGIRTPPAVAASDPSGADTEAAPGCHTPPLLKALPLQRTSRTSAFYPLQFSFSLLEGRCLKTRTFQSNFTCREIENVAARPQAKAQAQTRPEQTVGLNLRLILSAHS